MDDFEQKILAAAKKINERDAAKKRLDDALSGHQYMVRWNRPSGSDGNSYDSIAVSREDIEHLIRRKMEPIAEAHRQLAEDEVREVMGACQPC